MNLSEKYRDVIEFTGCEKEMEKFMAMISVLEDSGTKNIAVLGETNCGKTSLINRLCGQEVRTPTRISCGEDPLMVTFGSAEMREGFEKVDIQNEKCAELGIAFYEIPLNQAIDYDTKQPTELMEGMDAVIYVMSALMPFSGSDVSNLAALVDKFPLMIWISKTDLQDEESEYEECMEHVRREFSYHFKDTLCDLYDGKDEDLFNHMLGKFADVSLDEIREYHVMRIEHRAKAVMEHRLKQMLAKLKEKRKVREQKKSEVDEAYRQKRLSWDGIRMAMLEREQESVDYANKELSRDRSMAKKDAALALRDARDKKEWLSNDFKDMLDRKLQDSSKNITETVKKMADTHAEWLVSEVNRRFGKILELDNMSQGRIVVGRDANECDSTPDYKKFAMAAGTGLVAGGVIFSSLSVIPTCIVALPVTILTVSLLKEGMNDYENYCQSMIRFTEECCDQNYQHLADNIHERIHIYYEEVIAAVIRLGEEKDHLLDFEDIERGERAIHEKLQSIR